MATTARQGMAPFLVIDGTMEDPQPTDVSVVAENRVLLKSMKLLDALESMLLIYYVCNIEYPKECLNTFLFLQRMAMKVFDTRKVPTKVLLLMSELSKM